MVVLRSNFNNISEIILPRENQNKNLIKHGFYHLHLVMARVNKIEECVHMTWMLLLEENRNITLELYNAYNQN